MEFQEFSMEYEEKKVFQYHNNVIEKPLISVSVVTYQHVNYIRECLNGILMQQTLFSFEILLGDDESTDGTREICIEYAKRYPDKIRLFLHHRENNIEINGEPSGRFNFMYNLFSARGKYIALCDGDDYWFDPLKLQKQVEYLQSQPETVFTFTSNKYLYQDGRLNSRAIEDIPEIGNFKTLLDQNSIISSTVVFKNSIPIEGLPALLAKTYVGDWPLFLWLLRTKGVYNFLKFESTVYRKHVGILVKYKTKPLLSLESQIQLKGLLLKEPEFVNYQTEILKSQKRNWLQIMAHYNKRKKYIKGLRYFSKAFEVAGFPQQLRIYLYSISLGLQKNY
ncbi:glycosyltransferase [Antarcticibacterium sp. 1MA-6-2]|uniref:glycosyltransferase family 2 protein n=1 Tax=Antarcticibacterium sp. 1MA-6-2 TaxID=2908210 RepID=UPI001F29FD40|nr:glycosyltransferase [Antarcticibacterium sp. 1MA-6-2]UJH92522.1 glycosyltransferase [Antarcticibacterium sp. 1MA-6-2]